MKIALINNFPSYSGTGRVAYGLFRALRGFQRPGLGNPKIDLYCTHYLQKSDLDLPENREVKFLHHFPYRDQENLSRFLIYFIDPFRVPQGYDLYHITNHMLGNYLYFLKPAIVTVHDLLQFKYPEDRGDRLSSRVYNFLLRRSLAAIPRARKVVCVSEWTRREVLKTFNLPEEKVTVVYNGINHRVFRPGDRSQARRGLGLPLEPKIILHVGAETKRKNIPTLLQALAGTSKDDDGVILVRIGEKKEATARLIRQLGLEGKVRHFENVGEADLVKCYQAADVTVLPSFDEGFGFPVLESLACGTPVVCSKVGPLPEIGGEAVLCFHPWDVDDLVQKIRGVLRCNTLEYYTRRKVGLAQAQRFSWERAAGEILTVYESIGV